MDHVQRGDVCRVISPATLRTGKFLTSQWICEFQAGTLLEILDIDSGEVGRRRARVQTQLAHLHGWISLRTAGLDYLVEKLDDDELTFQIPEATQICGQYVPPFSSEDAGSIEAALAHVIAHIKAHPDFLLLSAPQTLSERIAHFWGRGSRNSLEQELEQRHNVWSSLSFRQDPIEGLGIVAMLLISQQAAMLELVKTFGRLHEEIWCLEDTDADTLFHVHGETRQALTLAKELAKKCESVAFGLMLPDISWKRPWPDPTKVVDALDRGKTKLQYFQDSASRISGQRRIFVARLKAAVEARAATEAVSAITLLSEVLKPGKRLDFPLVTELYDRATSDASELAQVADTMEALLDSPDLPTRLKVLTIINELLYDDSARQVFASRGSFLRIGHASAEETNMALELAAANANLLASEISRRLSSEAAIVQAVQAGCFSVLHQTSNASWLTSVARTPERQDAQLEPLSWSRTRSAICALDARFRSGTASAADAISVLDQIYRSFEHATGSILKLQQSMDHACDNDFRELTEGFLLSAAHVQSSALEWKCQVVDAADVAAPDQPSSNSIITQKLSRPLSKFLGRANSVGDSLNACLTVLLARREPA